MSGAFYYPREEHHVVINFNDEVDVSWYSDFANQLAVSCYEGTDTENTWSYTYNVDENGTQAFSPLQLSRQFKDWSLPAGCALTITKAGGGYIAGATVGVTSVATQAASILAESSTVAFDPTSSVTSATYSPSATLSSASATSLIVSTPSISPASPTPSASAVADSSGDGSLSVGAKTGIGVGVGISALVIAAVAYLFYRNHRKIKDLEKRISYQPQADGHYKPTAVAVGQHGDMEYQRPYSDAGTWSQVHQSSPQLLPQELSGIR